MKDAGSVLDNAVVCRVTVPLRPPSCVAIIKCCVVGVVAEKVGEVVAHGGASLGVGVAFAAGEVDLDEGPAGP